MSQGTRVNESCTRRPSALVCHRAPDGFQAKILQYRVGIPQLTEELQHVNMQSLAPPVLVPKACVCVCVCVRVDEIRRASP